MAEFFAKETIKSLRKLRQLKPDLFKGFMDWDQMVFKDGALSAKIKELMAVTAAHVTQCPWCIEDHVKRAIKHGATDEEIAEAVFVATWSKGDPAFPRRGRPANLPPLAQASSRRAAQRQAAKASDLSIVQ